MGDNMGTQTYQLSQGAEVKLRPVPPYLFGELHAELPLPPIYPKIVLTSPAGAEEAPALPDSDEYKEYRKKQREWEILRNRKLVDFTLDYGVVSWKLPDEDHWRSTPPENWAPDPVLVQWGLVKEAENLRVLFIKQLLIVTDHDMNIVDQICGGIKTLSEEEIQAALVPFDSNENTDQ